MHPDTKLASAHMREFGLNVFGRAIHDAAFDHTAPFVHALAVVHAAHAAEILLKARIAEEHPLLIFSKLPTLNTTVDLLNVEELFQHGRSYDFFELPNLLWATTGIRVANLPHYREFGILRNQITHFAVPNVRLATQTLKFCFEVLEPLLTAFWSESPIDYASDWNDTMIEDGFLERRLLEEGVVISETARAFFRERANQG